MASNPVEPHNGYLTKEGKLRKSWKFRWFVLENGVMTYYKTKGGKRLGEFSVRGIFLFDIRSTFRTDHNQ